MYDYLFHVLQALAPQLLAELHGEDVGHLARPRAVPGVAVLVGSGGESIGGGWKLMIRHADRSWSRSNPGGIGSVLTKVDVLGRVEADAGLEEQGDFVSAGHGQLEGVGLFPYCISSQPVG